MKPVDFELARPGTIAEALALIAGRQGTAKLLAGGQTLGPMLNLRFVQPEFVVDLSRIAELRRIEERTDAIVVGACTPHAAIEDGRVPDVSPRVSLIARCARAAPSAAASLMPILPPTGCRACPPSAPASPSADPAAGARRRSSAS
jgi:CO/xanthine dehydrogenase FAD-binding subunit